MNATNALILRSFLHTIAQLNEPLPTKINSELNQIGLALAQDNTKLIETLETLAYKTPQLSELYDDCCVELQSQYKTQERNKLFPPTSPDSADTSDLKIRENIAAPLPDKTTLPDLQKIASEILQAAEPQVAAQQKLAEFGVSSADWYLGLPI